MSLLDKITGKNPADNSEGKKPSVKTKKIKFLLSPTGKFNLAYSVGDIASLPIEKAAALIEAKYAEAVK